MSLVFKCSNRALGILIHQVLTLISRCLILALTFFCYLQSKLNVLVVDVPHCECSILVQLKVMEQFFPIFIFYSILWIPPTYNYIYGLYFCLIFNHPH